MRYQEINAATYLRQFKAEGAQVVQPQESDLIYAVPFAQTNEAVVYGATIEDLDIHKYDPHSDRTTGFGSRDEQSEDFMSDFLGVEDNFDDYQGPDYTRRDPSKTLRVSQYPSLSIEFDRKFANCEVLITSEPIISYRIVKNH